MNARDWGCGELLVSRAVLHSLHAQLRFGKQLIAEPTASHQTNDVYNSHTRKAGTPLPDVTRDGR